MAKGPGKAAGKASRRPVRPRAPRKRGTPRSRTPFGLVLVVAGIAALAILAVYGHRFLSSAPEAPADAVPPPPPAAQGPQPDHGPETPPLERALLTAGYERDRIGVTDGILYVETFDPPEVVAHKLQSANGTLKAAPDGDEVVVTAAGSAERLRVVTLKRDTEDESFVEAEPSRPDSARRAPAPAGDAKAGDKRIVLILDDVGFENQPLDEAASIDAALTFAVIPTAPRAERAARMLAERGFEVICHLPMEPLGYPRQSPGADAIMLSLTDQEIRDRTRAGLRAVPHAAGVNNHMGSRATRDRRVMENVAAVLREEGAYFIDSRTAGNSLAASVVGEGEVPVASRDVFLDDDPAEGAIRRQLAELVRIADRQDFAIGIGHVYPSTVKVLREQVPRLREQGYSFHFAREVVRRIDQPRTKVAVAPTASDLTQAP